MVGPLSIEELNSSSGKPPKYSDLYESPNSSLASTPPQYASKTPSVEISSSNETVDQPKPKVRIIKPKKNRKPKAEPEENQGNAEINAETKEEPVL